MKKKRKIEISDGSQESTAESAAAEGPDEEERETREHKASAPNDSTGATDEVAILRQEVEEWRDKYLRAKAELQNAMRRATNERLEAVQYANADLLRALLDVVDDFDRTLEISHASESVEAVVEGVRLIRDKMEKLLRDHAVEPIDAQDEKFDPNLHQALMRQPTNDHEPGTVVQQVQRGYKHRERVLRPAKVIVATVPPDESSADAEDEPGANGQA
jgi:molecular chaperone GrpE